MAFCIVAPAASCSTQAALLGVGIALLIAIFALFLRLALLERMLIIPVLRRVQVLSLRIGLVVPMFGIIGIFMMAFPHDLGILEFLQALAEGYCFYCFFKMVLLAAGPDEMVRQIIKASPDTGCLLVNYPIWSTCQHHPSCLTAIRTAFLQFLFARPLFVLIAGIFELKNEQTPDPSTFALYRLFTVLGILSLVATLPAIVRVYDVLARYMPELSPGKKVVFVKVSWGVRGWTDWQREGEAEFPPG